ncbi:non-ribosomal peptide synthetase, partial [Sphingobacterium siyangense]|uniref:non-ribosomal peptide synthetase n=4 Tax=Sphingobacterium TaxID=28453 RepID=UPI003DA6895F
MDELLKKISDNNIFLEVIDGELHLFCADEEVDSILLGEIKKNKEFLINMLKDNTVSLDDSDNIPYAIVNNVYELSAAQRRIWIVCQSEESCAAYNVFGSYIFNGAIDLLHLEKSFSYLIEKYDVLRTVFEVDNDDGNIKQKILPNNELLFKLEVSELNDIERVRHNIVGDFEKSFKLDIWPLMAAKVYKVDENKSYFSFVIHHIICDGWSLNILIKDLLDYYRNGHDENISLLPRPLQYYDYSEWQNKNLLNDKMSHHRTFWLDKFNDPIPVLNLTEDKPRANFNTFKGQIALGTIAPETAGKFRQILKESDTSMFMGLFAIVNILLYKFTGQTDIVIGTPVSGRTHHDLSTVVGSFVNTIPIRSNIQTEEPFLEFLGTVKANILECQQHQEYPFDELVQNIKGLNISQGRHPLFDVMMILHDTELDDMLNQKAGSELEIEFVDDLVSRTSKLDLQLTFVDNKKSIEMRFVYNTEIYNHQTIVSFIDTLNDLIENLLDNVSQPIALIDSVSAARKNKIIRGFNNDLNQNLYQGGVPYYFNEIMEKYPSKIALNDGSIRLTYLELDEYSNRIANYLMDEFNLTKGAHVAIIMDKSVFNIASLLAVLKIGAVYVPIDPKFPLHRIKFIVEDARAEVILCDFDIFYELDYISKNLIAVDLLFPQMENKSKVPFDICNPEDLAYIMYTSGSTGVPKGVLIEHGSILRLARLNGFLTLGSDDVLLSTGAISFDAVTFEYWGILLNGGLLVLYSNTNTFDSDILQDVILNNDVNILWLTSGLFNEIIEHKISLFERLKTVIAGGDILSIKHVNLLHEVFPRLQIFNGYGPTENTTFSTVYAVSDFAGRVPIGRPIGNTQVYILGPGDCVQPIGAVGEICLGGAGLARGYLNLEELTTS